MQLKLDMPLRSLVSCEVHVYLKDHKHGDYEHTEGVPPFGLAAHFSPFVRALEQ